MGQAMLTGWIKNKIDIAISVIDPALPPNIKDRYMNQDINWCETATSINRKADILVLAVKPQILEKAADPTKSFIHKNTLILSIAAGKTIHNLTSVYGNDQPVIRCMPNTPASIGQGVIIGTCNSNVSEKQKKQVEILLSPLGFFDWVEQESTLDAVTAISGSGPAYVFLFIEALKQAALELGISSKLADTLARQTVKGAAILASQEDEKSIEELRKAVTSPGGTTEQALNILMNNNAFSDLIEHAAQAAYEKSKELSN